MSRSGTMVRAFGVWMTAVMTLAAGFPQFICACPGGPGNATPAFSSPQPCPCCGGCCGQSSGQECCCGANKPEPSKSVPSDRGSGRSICKKAFGPTQSLARPSRTAASGPDAAPALWLHSRPEVISPVPPAAAFSAFRTLPHHGPPHDLVILLQHFLI
jgi:hypothetical protein